MSTEMRMRAMEAAVQFYANERGGGFRNIKPLAEQIYDWVMETPSHLHTHLEVTTPGEK